MNFHDELDRVKKPVKLGTESRSDIEFELNCGAPDLAGEQNFAVAHYLDSSSGWKERSYRKARFRARLFA